MARNTLELATWPRVVRRSNRERTWGNHTCQGVLTACLVAFDEFTLITSFPSRTSLHPSGNMLAAPMPPSWPGHDVHHHGPWPLRLPPVGYTTPRRESWQPSRHAALFMPLPSLRASPLASRTSLCGFSTGASSLTSFITDRQRRELSLSVISCQGRYTRQGPVRFSRHQFSFLNLNALTPCKTGSCRCAGIRKK